MGTLLERHGISPTLGCLPEERRPRLPEPFAALERVTAALPELLVDGRLRAEVDGLRLPDTAALSTEADLRRAMMLLSFLGNAYVWGGDEPARTLPAGIAVPWCRVADRLGRPPIASHASVALENWVRTVDVGGFRPEGLRTQVSFSGTDDESWFFLTTVTIEQRAARGLCAVAALVSGQDVHGPAAEAALTDLRDSLRDATETLHRMFERCSAPVFYDRIRPYLASWPAPGVSYEGVHADPRQLMGGSAAQSSFFHVADAALGVRHDARCGGFLRAMRDYMPPGHRAFVALAGGLGLRDRIRASGAAGATGRFNECVGALCDFREAHLGVIQRYILEQAPDETGGIGTGGSHLRAFLESVLASTRATAI